MVLFAIIPVVSVANRKAGGKAENGISPCLSDLLIPLDILPSACDESKSAQPRTAPFAGAVIGRSRTPNPNDDEAQHLGSNFDDFIPS